MPTTTACGITVSVGAIFRSLVSMNSRSKPCGTVPVVAAPPGRRLRLLTSACTLPRMVQRSEERRVGKECRSGWGSDHSTKVTGHTGTLIPPSDDTDCALLNEVQRLNRACAQAPTFVTTY